MRWLTTINSALSHLALWASLYIVGAVVCMGQVGGFGLVGSLRGREGLGLAYALCTGVAVYLLDRVKLRDRWLDPADAQAHPARFGFLASHSRAVRALAAAMALGSVVFGWMLSPLAPVLTLGACVGVVAYAGRPRLRRARIKDVFLLKNGFVAAGITAFAVAVVLMAKAASLDDAVEVVRTHVAALVIAAAQLFIRVFADAAVCDLDDEHADRSYRTATLPTRLGRIPAWNVAAAMRVVLGLAMLAVPGPARVWGVVTVVSTVVMRAWNPRRLREPVDGRLAVEAGLVWMVLHATR